MAFAIQRGIDDIVDAPFAAFEQHGVGQPLPRAVAAGELGEHLGGVASFRDRGHAEGDKMGRRSLNGSRGSRGASRPLAMSSSAAIERNSEREKKRARSVLSPMTPAPRP